MVTLSRTVIRLSLKVDDVKIQFRAYTPAMRTTRRPGPRNVAAAPRDQTALHAHLEELVRQGKARRGTGTLPADFFTRSRPKFEGRSVLDQLLRDRDED